MPQPSRPGAVPSTIILEPPGSSAWLAAREIRELHRFFEQWFRGGIPGTPAVFSRVSGVWNSSFEIIAPDGRLREAEELLASTFSEYGAFPGISIRIENLEVRELASGAVVSARYEERHEDGGSVEHRLCSATLARPDPGSEKMIWIQIHESPLPVG